MPYGGEIVKTERGNAVKLTKNRCLIQTMWHGALRQAPKPRKMRFSLKASGKGAIHVWFKRYRDTDDPTGKHGYIRSNEAFEVLGYGPVLCLVQWRTGVKMG